MSDEFHPEPSIDTPDGRQIIASWDDARGGYDCPRCHALHATLEAAQQHAGRHIARTQSQVTPWMS